MSKAGSEMLPPKMEPGEITVPDIPPFPSYSIEPERPTMAKPPRYPFPRSLATGGPIPAPGTPQDRFAAVLGRPRYTSMPASLMGMDMSTNAAFSSPSLQQPTAFSMHLAAPGVANPGPLTPPQQVPNFTAPEVRKPQAASIARPAYSSGGRGPTLPEPGAPMTAWLSFECQRRHFNPEFRIKEIFTEDGRPKYRCTVIVKDHVIDSNTLFSEPAEAKTHVATKALKYIRKEWPRSALPASSSGDLGQVSGKKQGESLNRREEQLRQMLKQRHQAKSTEPLQPSPAASSSVNMSDPAQALAFVEGFKVGRLAGLAGLRDAAGSNSSPPPNIPQTRRRSRSPGRGRSSSLSKADEPYRQRSPVRDAPRTSRGALSPPRYFDGTRHDSRLPSTDRYRPRRSPSTK